MLEEKLHQIQRDILNILLYSKSARFTDLNVHELSNDHFSFHIKKLVGRDLIMKDTDGNYILTNTGKSFVTSMDFRKNIHEQRQKIIGMVILTQKIEGVEKILTQKRLRNPYFDYYGLPTTRIPRGNKFTEVIKSELLENTGFTCDIDLIGIEHKMDYSIEQELLEDNIFFIYKAKNVSGSLKNEFYAGTNHLMTKEEVMKKEYVFGNVAVALRFLESEHIDFEENTYTVKKF